MFRVGIGYDVHKFCKGRELVLGGVKIPFDLGLEGHSDADVLVHAICDALLGAAALGDIGEHFPDSDARFKGVSSLLLLREVVSKITDFGYEIVNVDSVLVAQRPKLKPYKDQMRINISEVLKIPVECISVKATTTEGLGFEGRMEGISAQAVALIRRV